MNLRSFVTGESTEQTGPESGPFLFLFGSRRLLAVHQTTDVGKGFDKIRKKLGADARASTRCSRRSRLRFGQKPAVPKKPA